MAGSVPPAPEFGETITIEPAPEVLAFLARRRSASAMALVAPGPSEEELADLLRLAVRVPDHGKLAPWRFVLLRGEAKAAFAAKIAPLAADQANPVKATAAMRKLTTPPLAIAVIARPLSDEVPKWEQVMSAGAVCTQLLLAASAMGYGANWITDWYSFDERALAILGVAEGEQVAGFLYVGTTAEQPQERPRPDVAAITSEWTEN
ncbi:nitroreductase family protein [Caulobacter hibisci]|uniref:Putative NAD(P)H nitroreductase n=1 Tax=Caulobacter hibisci TaxID=2035993 RepID=A0ABS0T494_9CAUL|nr:nitroreductase [Caulobacter hibisci]MBI1686489.1 nitroreductase [Caulobacter hibisci]